MADKRASPWMRGFTLIDLAFTLAVAAILASVVTISMLGNHESDMAEATVRQIQAILDAARWVQYQNQQALMKDTGVQDIFANCTGTGRWPGQVVRAGGKYKCKNTMSRQQLIEDLQGSESNSNIFLPPATSEDYNRVFVNLWGEDIEFSLDSPGPDDGLAEPLVVSSTGTTPGDEDDIVPYCRPASGQINAEVNCWFRVSTNVPETVANIFRTTLPNAYCESVDGVGRINPVCPPSSLDTTVPPDFTRCCTMIARPGTEPRFQEWVQLRPPTWCAPWWSETKKICPNNMLPPE